MVTDASASAGSPPAGLPEANSPDPADAGQGGSSPGMPDQGGKNGVGQDQPPEDGPPAWAELKTLDDVFALEDVKGRHDTAVTEAHAAGGRDMQSQLQPILNQHEKYLGEIDLKLSNFGASWNKIANSGEIKPEQLAEVLRANAGAFTALVGLQQDTGIWMGLKGAMREIGKQSGDDALGNEFVARAENLKNGLTDPTFYPDLVKRVSAVAVATMQKKLDEAEAEVAQMKTAQGDDRRAERGQRPAAATGVGGGRLNNDNQSRLDRLYEEGGKNATAEDREWIRQLGN